MPDQSNERPRAARTVLATAPEVATLRATGIETLDAMLGGGMKPGATWLVEGRPGAGKSLLSAHFLAAGIARGEPCLYITAAESPASLLQSFAQGWPTLEKAITQRQLAVLDPSPFFTEMRLLKDRADKARANIWDEVWRFAQDVVKQSRNQGAKRIVIDPVTPLLLAYDSAIELWDAAHTFVNAMSETLGATTLLTHVTLADPTFESIGANLRALCHGALQLEWQRESMGDSALAIRINKLRHRGIAQREAICVVGEGGQLLPAHTTAWAQRGQAA